MPVELSIGSCFTSLDLYWVEMTSVDEAETQLQCTLTYNVNDISSRDAVIEEIQILHQ